MRNLLLSLAVVALLAAPGVADIQLSFLINGASTGTLTPGTYTVNLQVTGDANTIGAVSAVSTMAGDITTSGTATGTASGLTMNAVWKLGLVPGTSNTLNPTAAGLGWNQFTMQQNNANADVDLPGQFGNGVVTDLASYSITVAPGTLSFGFAADNSFANSALNNTQVQSFGGDVPVVVAQNSFLVTPEPVSMALLALGGLFVARRRSH